MKKLYLSCRSKGVSVSLLGEGEEYVVRTLDEFYTAVAHLAESVGMHPGTLLDGGFMHSSSMNWPEDDCDDSEVLDLVELLMAED